VQKLKPGGLIGRKILAVDWNVFLTGRSGHPRSTDPVLFLDDGTSISFVVIETEIGEYGVEVRKFDGKNF
jgi:hypothetical protein